MVYACETGRVSQASKRFFFAKKNPKTFGPPGQGREAANAPDPAKQSFFASFCSQKEVLRSYLNFLDVTRP
jgi:hypothetical protein